MRRKVQRIKKQAKPKPENPASYSVIDKLPDISAISGSPLFYEGDNWELIEFSDRKYGIRRFFSDLCVVFEIEKILGNVSFSREYHIPLENSRRAEETCEYPINKILHQPQILNILNARISSYEETKKMSSGGKGSESQCKCKNYMADITGQYHIS